MATRSFDLIGDIAVIEASTKKEEMALVKKILSTYPRVKAILRKESEAKGRYRLRDFSIVFQDKEKVRKSGLKATETVHVENGCRFLLDVRKVFFNPRNATVRQRIAGEVRKGERVLVMFSGIGPFPILIARRVKGCEVVGVELNPAAVRYALENARLNRVQERIELFQGDVRAFASQKQFDRIIMPLAVFGYRYLDKAIDLCAKGGVIHLFGLGDKKNPLEALEKEIAKAARKKGRKYSILSVWTVSTYSPSLLEVCVNIRIE